VGGKTGCTQSCESERHFLNWGIITLSDLLSKNNNIRLSMQHDGVLGQGAQFI
jgi:hypothetical protein